MPPASKDAVFREMELSHRGETSADDHFEEMDIEADEKESLTDRSNGVTHALKLSQSQPTKAVTACAMYSACSVSMILVNKSLASRYV
jgi:hypothetical protein